MTPSGGHLIAESLHAPDRRHTHTFMHVAPVRSARDLLEKSMETTDPPRLQPVARSLALAPDHLTPASRVWWDSVVKDYDLEAHHLRLLQSAAEAWDRMQQAREALATHGGLTFTTDKGDIKAHPAVAMERDARVAFARLVRELDLDAGALADAPRPPAIASNRRG